jgi:hypothetical protein
VSIKEYPRENLQDLTHIHFPFQFKEVLVQEFLGDAGDHSSQRSIINIFFAYGKMGAFFLLQDVGDYDLLFIDFF